MNLKILTYSSKSSKGYEVIRLKDNKVVVKRYDHYNFIKSKCLISPLQACKGTRGAWRNGRRTVHLNGNFHTGSSPVAPTNAIVR